MSEQEFKNMIKNRIKNEEQKIEDLKARLAVQEQEYNRRDHGDYYRKENISEREKLIKELEVAKINLKVLKSKAIKGFPEYARIQTMSETEIEEYRKQKGVAKTSEEIKKDLSWNTSPEVVARVNFHKSGVLTPEKAAVSAAFADDKKREAMRHLLFSCIEMENKSQGVIFSRLPYLRNVNRNLKENNFHFPVEPFGDVNITIDMQNETLLEALEKDKQALDKFVEDFNQEFSYEKVCEFNKFKQTSPYITVDTSKTFNFEENLSFLKSFVEKNKNKLSPELIEQFNRLIVAFQELNSVKKVDDHILDRQFMLSQEYIKWHTKAEKQIKTWYERYFEKIALGVDLRDRFNVDSIYFEPLESDFINQNHPEDVKNSALSNLYREIKFFRKQIRIAEKELPEALTKKDKMKFDVENYMHDACKKMTDLTGIEVDEIKEFRWDPAAGFNASVLKIDGKMKECYWLFYENQVMQEIGLEAQRQSDIKQAQIMGITLEELIEIKNKQIQGLEENVSVSR